MKKIILAIGQLYGGGAERVVSIWSKKLMDSGYDVSILVCGRCDKEYEIDPNIKIISIVPKYNDFSKISYIKRYFKYRKILKKLRPDVVISFLPTTQIWLNLASIGLKYKRIETVRNNPWLSFKTNSVGKRLWNRCFNKADSIIIQTREQIEYFSNRNKKKCVLISNPISEKFLIDNQKEFKTEIIKFLASGRLVPQKNYPLMIKAFKKAHEKNPNIFLDIYGVGNKDYTESLRKLIKDEKIENTVFLKGYSNNMIEELRAADAFLLTSDYEGLPNALIEAMASKLICISTDCKTGPKDLIDHNINGFLAKTGDVNSITDCILLAANLSSSQIISMGNNAHEKIADFCSDEKCFKALLNIIEN